MFSLVERTTAERYKLHSMLKLCQLSRTSPWYWMWERGRQFAGRGPQALMAHVPPGRLPKENWKAKITTNTGECDCSLCFMWIITPSCLKNKNAGLILGLLFLLCINRLLVCIIFLNYIYLSRLSQPPLKLLNDVSDFFICCSAFMKAFYNKWLIP